MTNLIRVCFWALVGSSAVVAIARYFHPATFPVVTFSALVGMACVAGACMTIRKRYE